MFILSGGMTLSGGLTFTPTYNLASSGLRVHLDAANTSSYPGSGSTWTDLSGTGNNATLINTPVYSASFGGYIGDNGSNTAYMSLANASSTLVFGTGDFTIEIWHRPKFDTTSGSVSAVLFQIGGVLLSWDNIYKSWNGESISTGGSGTYTARPDSNNNILALCPQNIWKQVVYRRQGTTAQIFYNGALVATGTDNANYTGGGPQGNYWIGERDPYPEQQFKCDVSILRIYNRAISNLEISDNFNLQKTRYSI